MAAHPDDAVLSCWNALTRADVRTVVTVFAGLPSPDAPPSPWDRLTRCADPTRRLCERLDEDRRALDVAGCSPLHLDFTGRSYRRTSLDLAAVASALSCALADATDVWVPAAIGGHADHVVTRDVALEVTGGRSRRLYADLPYACAFGWPPWVTGEESDPELDVDGWWEAHLEGLGRGELTARAHRLDATAQADKQRAISCYRSQVPALAAVGGGRRSAGEEPAYEVTWELG